MIFVTLGTQDKGFPRLLKEIDKEIKNGHIKEEVIVQSGYTKYTSKNMKILDLVNTEEFKKYIKECDLLITHGGVGSILEGIKQSKKIIAVPRRKEYKEHTNNHQLQILKEFASQNYIIAIENVADLKDAIEKSKTFEPKPFKSNTKKFINSLENYIAKTNHTSKLNKYIYALEKGQMGILESIINLILFSLWYPKYNLLVSVILAYLCSFIIEKCFHLFTKCSPSLKYYFYQIFFLGLDLLGTFLFVTYLPLPIFFSKTLSNTILFVISIVISKK